MSDLRFTLIDDSASSNLYHKIMMEDAGIEVDLHVDEYTSSIEARDYFQNLYDKNLLDQFPDVILLDINIPLFNGWDMIAFLEGLDLGKWTPKIFMVSNSRNPRDLDKAKEHSIVIDILEKHVEMQFFKDLSEH